CPHHGFTKLHQLDTFYNALNPADQDSLNSVAGGNLLERRTQDVLTIIENKSKIAKLTHAVNQQTSAVTTAMTTILKQFQATLPLAFVKAVEEIYVTCGGAHPYYQCLAADGNTLPEFQDNIQGYVSAATSPFQQGELLEPANTPLNENCSAVILKKLPEKLGDPGKFLILYGFSELKCKALSDLGASINLMPLSVWKKLGLPELISTRMTLELANREICTPVGIARDVFVPVGKFTFPVDFVIVDYESDPYVPLILGRPFLRTARALIGVHGEEMILCDGNERLPLNMIHDTSSYSTQPHQESINMIDVYNFSHKEILKDWFATNHQSPTFSSHTDLTSPEVINPSSGNPTQIWEPVTKSSSSSPTLTSLEESDLIWEEFKAYLASDSFPPGIDDTEFDPEGDLHLIEELLNNDPSSPLPLSHNPLSGSTISSSSNHLL
ncbi:reverse transcriptase domain-containing protein, partial [Tanacetum coccineum]